VSSNGPSENPLVLDRIAEDIPTTPEDVAALRRARERCAAGFSLEQVHLLEPPDWFPRPPRRRTFAGFEPFEL
jgi:hypothetical protein